MEDLKDTVVAITGASAGIGRATARELASHGANVEMDCEAIRFAGERAHVRINGPSVREGEVVRRFKGANADVMDYRSGGLAPVAPRCALPGRLGAACADDAK